MDYGDVKGFAEGSAVSLQLPEYPFTMGLAVLCEGGSVEFTFRAGGVEVDFGACRRGSSLSVYEKGKPPRPLACQAGDGYANQAAAFIEPVRGGHAPVAGTPEQGRLAVATALGRPAVDRDRPGCQSVDYGAYSVSRGGALW